MVTGVTLSSGSAAAAPLRTRALRSSAWTLSGYAIQQAIRLGGNLVLARLLFPEAFGLMALVHMVLHGLQMFADTGIRGKVIQSTRGESDEFINTAWTIGIIRGSLLWLASVALAWPISKFYDQPALLLMIPTVGLNAIIAAFESTAVLRLQKRVELRPIVLRDAVAQIVGLTVTIGFAFYWPSVWVLVIGTLISASMRLFSSYWLLPGPRPRFVWDTAAASEMFRYGRWIFVATAVTFLLKQGDRIILGKILTPSELGVYAIAAIFAKVGIDAIQKLNNMVLFPVYTELVNQRPHLLRRNILRTRLLLLAATLPLVWILILHGERIIGLLYDERYAEAGWILEVLAAGVVGSLVGLGAGANVLLARGESYRFMLMQIARGLLLVATMFVGYQFGDVRGMVIGVAAASWLDYVFVVWAIRGTGVWEPWLDLSVFAASAGVILWSQ